MVTKVITMSEKLCCLLFFFTFVNWIKCNDNLRVAYEWKQIEFQYRNAIDRDNTLHNKNNAIPVGLEVYKSRLFITLPRWREGVPASLAYLDLNDTRTISPSLIPFPSWQSHNLQDEAPEIVSPFRIRADKCGRLWVLDTRVENILGDTKKYGNTQLLIYDLHNDFLLRRYVFPDSQVKSDSFFANIAVEDGDCDNTFAYAGDLGAPGLVVYSWKHQSSWRVHHHYFHPDPLSGNFTINGTNFQWGDGLFGLAISKQQPDGFANLYFHPFSSTMEFSVSTKVLRNKTNAESSENYDDFKILGSRGPNGESGASFLDQLTGVLFYSLPNLNAVACWKTSNRAYTIKSQGRIYMSSTEMLFPNDVKVDDQDHLWVLSDRLHEYMYGKLDPNNVNFRILTAHVEDAIENTACDIKTKPLPDLINKLGDILNPKPTPTSKSNTLRLSSLLIIFVISNIFIMNV